MAIRKTIQLGESVLRETSKSVEDYNDSHTQQVIEDLIDTMRDNDLVGMAAPQIGESLRIFVSEVRETKYRKGITEKLQVYINPVITHESEKTILGYEGCGSIPGIFGQVERAEEITIDYVNEIGQQETVVLNNFLAVIAQHEVDHLTGIMFTDLADPITLVSGEYYMEHIRGK